MMSVLEVATAQAYLVQAALISKNVAARSSRSHQIMRVIFDMSKQAVYAVLCVILPLIPIEVIFCIFSDTKACFVRAIGLR
jgi:hypothetical protein